MKGFKSVAIIWTAVAITGALTAAYVNAAINEQLPTKQKPVAALQGDFQQHVADPVVTISGGSLQPAYAVDATQPALGYNMIQGTHDEVQTIN